VKRFKNILYVYESEKDNQSAIERAVKLAENNQSSLTMIEVLPVLTVGIGFYDAGLSLTELQTAQVEIQKQNLNTLAEQFAKGIEIKTKVLVGTAFLEIIREVLRDERDLVIKIPGQHNWLERLCGSDDMHLLRKCPCPVWLIQSKESNAYQHILAAVDVYDFYPPKEIESRRALNIQILEMASSLSLAEAAELHIIHAWVPFGESALHHGGFMMKEEKEVKEYVEQIKEKHAANLDELMHEVAAYVGQETLDYLKPQIHLVKGGPHVEVPALAKQMHADLVVMGTVARTGIPGFFMGNTAETILNQIDCSVLAIKPPGFVTPVTLDD
jgi:nucleotide-binding universal stress UspA family protein